MLLERILLHFNYKCKKYAEIYLLNIDNTTKRRAMTQWRVGCHHLKIEALRGTIKDSKLRRCFCQDTHPEDEFHFLMTGTKFESERVKIFAAITKITANFAALNKECKFQWILANEDKHKQNNSKRKTLSGIFRMTHPLPKLFTVWGCIMNVINILVKNDVHVRVIQNILIRLYQVVVLSFCIVNVFCYCMCCECFERKFVFWSQRALDCK